MIFFIEAKRQADKGKKINLVNKNISKWCYVSVNQETIVLVKNRPWIFIFIA